MKRTFAFAVLFCLLISPLRAQVLQIAAIVNDEVISQLDVEDRLSLIALSTSIELNDDNRAKLSAQVLRNLIDEKLQLQEARKLGINVSDAEITAASARLAAQNNIPPDQFAAFIDEKGGSYNSLLDQIRATIGWTKIVRQKFSSSAVVTEDEIDQAAAREKTNLSAPQYAVSEIFLPVEKPGDEASVKDIADNLIAQILQGSAFDSLARQFSQSSSAQNGGDLGWVKRGQLPALLDQKLGTMQPNQVAKPVRMADGYVILMLRETRVPEEGSVPEVNRQAIADQLRQKKLESAARKYLRDLRTLALVDLRA